MRIQNNCKNLKYIYLIIEAQHLELSKLLEKLKTNQLNQLKRWIEQGRL